jgi:hypothetical protein
MPDQLNDAGLPIADEDPKAGKKSRKRTKYITNHTAALAFPEELSDDEEELFEQSAELIMEHASRRVDLMFYTLVAYYGSQRLPSLGTTNLQHGMGKNSGVSTNACHSSLLPTLVDDVFENSLTKNVDSLIAGTHLLNSANSTVELPRAVNVFDSFLENKKEARKVSLIILSLVSLGVMTPISGISMFLDSMDKILKKMEREIEKPKKGNSRYSFFAAPQLNAKLVERVAAGTLEETFSSETRTVNRAYVHSLLRLPATQDFTPIDKIEENDYQERILEIQAEILNSRIKPS